MEVLRGDGQTATAGSAVAVPPAVRITDADGKPVAGVTVAFEVASGGGTITGAVDTTNADGVAEVERWVLGPDPGDNAIIASVGFRATDFVQFTATGLRNDVGECSTSVPSGADAHEPDNCPADATALTDPDETDGAWGSEQEHSIYPAGDVDWYELTTAVSSTVCFEVSRPSGPDAYAYLINEAGDTLSRGDTDGLYDSSRDRWLGRFCASNQPAGTYYLKVRGESSDDELGSYWVRPRVERTP